MNVINGVDMDDMVKAVEALDKHKIPAPNFLWMGCGLYEYEDGKWIKVNGLNMNNDPVDAV